MQPVVRRFPSTSSVLSKLGTTKPLILRWGLPRFTTLLQTIPGLRWIKERKKDATQSFIVIISCHYGRWRAHPSGESMQLDTVQGDMKLLLDHLGYQHDNADGHRWIFLMDYPFNYEDYSHTTKPLPRTGLPTRDNILRTIREAARNGCSGLIHYSGHCYYQTPGESVLEHHSNYTIYKEAEGSRQGPKAAYLVSCDGKRIYGEEFYRSLQNTSNEAGASAITVVLDTCEAEAFIKDFEDLPIVYDAESVSIVSNEPIPSRQRLRQLVVVTAARTNEMAWTVDGCGVLTYFLIECLQKYPTASAAKLVNLLDIECQGQPDENKRQHPRIWSRYPLIGPFRLLPKSALALIDHTLPSVLQSRLEEYLALATQYALDLEALGPNSHSIMVL